MAMVKCKECGKEISSDAKICPNCGAKIKKKTGCSIFVISFIGIMFIVYIISQMSGNNFEDVGYYKMKTKNGSNSRVYSVYVNDFSDSPEIWDKIQKYAKNKMYTAGGTTIVFFFNDKNNTPDVTYVGAEFDKKYEKYCVAAFWKYPTGKETFGKYPFK